MRPRAIRLFVVFVLAVASLLASVSSVAAANATGINVQLPAGHTISGTITRQVGGTAVVGGSLYAYGSAGFSYATTSASGAYTLKALPNGSYTVFISTPDNLHLQDGYYTTSNSNHFTTSAANATAITISGANATGKNMKLPADPATHSISGKITRASGGTALVGAAVTASGTAGFNSVVTNSSGNYTIPGLFPGSYVLSVTPPSGVNLQSGCYRSTSTGHFTATCSTATHLTISTANLTGKNVALPNGLTISGTLTDRSSNPLAYAGVSATSLTGQFDEDATTDSVGHFLVIGLSPGTFEVELGVPYGANVLDGFYSSANTYHWVRSESSATHISLTVNKALGTIKPASGFKISGKIMNSAGTGLQYASVSASGSAGFAYASTSATGTFALVGLPAGTYRVSVSPPYANPTLQSGFYRSSVSTGFTPNQTSATLVTLGPNKTGVNIKLPSGFSISGKITRSGGIAVPDDFVYTKRTVSSVTYTYYAYTNSTGNYVFRGLPAGSYKVHVSTVVPLNLLGGWYRSSAAGHYTALETSATSITIGP
jgi:hypothetical protein